MKLIAKTASHTGVHMAVASLVTFALTGNWGISLGVALLEAVALTLIHPLHEWVWTRAPKLAVLRVPVAETRPQGLPRSRAI